jgi:hypothetical protein
MPAIRSVGVRYKTPETRVFWHEIHRLAAVCQFILSCSSRVR